MRGLVRSIASIVGRIMKKTIDSLCSESTSSRKRQKASPIGIPSKSRPLSRASKSVVSVFFCGTKFGEMEIKL